MEGLGYWLGGASGRYERLTEQAVMAFQKVEGLPRTGRFDGLTRAVFENATRPAPRSTAGDLVEVDKARQVLFLVRDGLVQWVFNTSTGTEGPYVYEGRTYLADTPEGMFRVSSAFDGLQDTPLGVLFRPRYFHPDGIAVHGSPSVPSYPASHGCVRVTDPAINWIWANDAMPFGSTVWVY
ncbi:MAG: L,D-transpeptidase family protein [Acidimicrobiia bacterium]|nr:L,D-transpeptidase family protein [Acidimicrobiia bacterium]